MNLHLIKYKFIALKALIAVVGIYVLYVFTVGMVTSTCPNAYEAPTLDDTATDQNKAAILADATTFALENQLDSFMGWIPNDLLFVPKILDNIRCYQNGIIYATRPASDIVAKTASRYGKNDTLDPRLVDATSRYFVYSGDVWGFWFIYDAESK